MDRYNFQQIKTIGDCREYVRNVLSIPVSSDGRCAAVWRGGTNPSSVVLTKDEWCDHGNGGEGGSIIDLCAVSKFGGKSDAAMQLAQEFLGQWLALAPVVSRTPQHEHKKTKYQELTEAGYKEIARYNYIDLDGKIIHFVVRMEHPEPAKHKKQFVQGTPERWGVDFNSFILYNLAAITASEWVVIVEGEKDADTLIALGVPATTVCGGAGKWQERYGEVLAGKQIIILPDNDDSGLIHAKKIAADLLDKAAGIKIVTVSKQEKGDVTDYLTKEGGTWDALSSMIAAAPEETRESLCNANDLFAINEAKAANKSDFRNFIPVKTEIGKTTKIQKEPKQLNALIEEVHTRFLGFPRKVGEQLFDHDRDTGEICYLYKQDSVFAWIQRKSKCRVDWSRNDGCVTRGELYEGLYAAAKRYEAISHVPDWPVRSDVYYAYPEMPAPDPEHKYFEGFVDFFNPAGDLYRILLKTFITSPLFYRYGISRPLWIIDSEDGAGTGKTTAVELIAQLYNGTPIKMDKQDMIKNPGEIIKRILSSEGRQKRIALMDNVTGAFSCRNLAEMVTEESISGRPAFGRGEETRPNNLTYVITANSANIDNDLASRAYYIIFRRPKYDATWKTRVMTYLNKYRFHILADIIDILDSHKPFELPPCTRCPEFETRILQAHCRDTDDYENIIRMLADVRSETNVEDELAKQIEEIIRHNILELNPSPRQLFNPDTQKIFIRSDVVKKWLERESIAEGNAAIQLVRNLANMGLLTSVAKTPRKWPHHGKDRRSGIMWAPSEAAEEPEEVRVIGKVANGKIGEIVKL